MKKAMIVGIAVTITLAIVIALYLFGAAPTLCKSDDVCLREWISASSGWAAVIAAIPTILYLSRQVRDADRHQRTSFAIQLRRQKILATRVAQIAQTVLDLTNDHDEALASGIIPDIRNWNTTTSGELVEILRQETLSAFEAEIAFPMGLSARMMAYVVADGLKGNVPACQSAPTLVRVFFKDIKTQALEYLAEVEKITDGS